MLRSLNAFKAYLTVKYLADTHTFAVFVKIVVCNTRSALDLVIGCKSAYAAMTMRLVLDKFSTGNTFQSIPIQSIPLFALHTLIIIVQF